MLKKKWNSYFSRLVLMIFVAGALSACGTRTPKQMGRVTEKLIVPGIGEVTILAGTREVIASELGDAYRLAFTVTTTAGSIPLSTFNEPKGLASGQAALGALSVSLQAVCSDSACNRVAGVFDFSSATERKQSAVLFDVDPDSGKLMISHAIKDSRFVEPLAALVQLESDYLNAHPL